MGSSQRYSSLFRHSWLASGRRPELIALVWACLLPIDQFLEIPERALSATSYSAVVVLVLITPATLKGESRTRLTRILALLTVLGLVRIVMGQYHGDGAGRMIGLVILASVVTCAPLAWRPRLHRSILFGYLIGATISGVVCLMQALDIPTLRPGLGPSRYPGLAKNTMVFTWQVVFAAIIAAYFLATSRRRSPRWNIGLVGLPVALIALLVNGAQGGLLGVAAALAGFLFWCDPRLRSRLRSRAVVASSAALILTVALVLTITDLRPSTFDDWVGGDFVNEQARVDIASTGWSTFLEHPVVGVGRQQFYTEHVIAPHFLPLESAVSAGVVAGLLATAVLLVTWAYMLAGPKRSSYALFGSVMLAAMCANTLTETSGPYVGIPRLILLVIAIVATTGDNEPLRPPTSSDVRARSAPSANQGNGG